MFAGDELARDPSLKFLAARIPRRHVAAMTALTWHGVQQNLAYKETLWLWGNEMPAIRWKLENLAKLKRTNPGKFSRQSQELASRLNG